MPCLFVLIFLGLPRLALICVWTLTTWGKGAFETVTWPALGFVFFPYTTLAYMWAAISTGHHINGGWVFVVVAGVLIDIGAIGSTKRRRRRRSK